MSTQQIERMLRNKYPEAALDYTGGGHIRLRWENGVFVTVSASPSDKNFMRQVEREIRRRFRMARGQWQRAGVAR